MTADGVRGTGAGPRSHAGAAPATARVLAQARWEALAVLRNGEQLLLTVLLPLVALVGLSRSSLIPLALPPGASRVDVVAPGVLAVAVLSTAFTGQAIATAFDRRHGVLRLLGTTPLGRSGLVAASRARRCWSCRWSSCVVLGAVAARARVGAGVVRRTGRAGRRPAWHGRVRRARACCSAGPCAPRASSRWRTWRGCCSSPPVACCCLPSAPLPGCTRCCRGPRRARSATGCASRSSRAVCPSPTWSCCWSGRRCAVAAARRWFRWD